MKKSVIYLMMTIVLALVDFTDASGQLYRRENRRGNRAFEQGDYEGAISHYEKSLQKDTINKLPLLYNMAYVLHSDRRDSTMNVAKDTLALKYLDQIAEQVEGTEYESDYHFNRGVISMDLKDWESAVAEFKKCLLLDPEDMKARENYIYAKEHLQKEQSGSGGGGGQNQQQEQNDDDQEQQGQDGDQNEDRNDQQDQQSQDEDQQNKDQQGQDGDQNEQQQGQQGGQQESKISQQAAQQILQAMQAKERETQEKVEKKKAAAMRSKQKEKNW